MADTKISALPASTTPLAGTEVLPIVQGGVTKKVSVANLTAGRSISATEATLTTGNLVIGTAGKGIDFSADSHAAGMTSELLDDYEEGIWTASITASGGGSITLNASYTTGSYTKVGRLVTVTGQLVVDSVSTPSGTLAIEGLPFTISNSGNEAATAAAITAFTFDPITATAIVARGVKGGTKIEIYRWDNPTIDNMANSVKGGSQFYFSMSYIV